MMQSIQRLVFRRHTCAAGLPRGLDDSFDLEEALEVKDLPKAHRHLHGASQGPSGRPPQRAGQGEAGQGKARRGEAGRGGARRGEAGRGGARWGEAGRSKIQLNGSRRNKPTTTIT